MLGWLLLLPEGGDAHVLPCGQEGRKVPATMRPPAEEFSMLLLHFYVTSPQIMIFLRFSLAALKKKKVTFLYTV